MAVTDLALRRFQPLFSTVAVGVVGAMPVRAAEGAARGAADLVRAAGDANLRNSLAARNIEEARSRNLDNHLKYTETYFEMRRINQEQRAAEREKHRPDPEQLFRIRQQRKPTRLASDQLNPVTGDIQWPLLLREDAFAEQREQLEACLSNGPARIISVVMTSRKLRRSARQCKTSCLA